MNFLIRFSFLLVFARLALAMPDEKVGRVEGTDNPEPIPAVDPDKALISTVKFPEEMVAKVFASEPNVQDPTAITFDEQNRLYIAETHRFDRGVEDNRRNGHWIADDFALETTADRLAMYKKYADKKPLSYFTEFSEKIRVIEDRDGNGKADFGQIFAEGFNDPLDGTAAGVMALDGKIYFACIPHVWLLEDTTGDLVADQRESLQEGYGISVSLSGHDLNGFALGPDNRIYFTIGDRGYNLRTKDGRHLYGQHEGAIFRMERDGSALEVVHTGLRNPKEIAFDRYGNAFSVDNDADMGDEARVVDVIEGAFSGWQRGYQAFQKFRNHIYGTRRHQSPWMDEAQWEIENDLRPKAILKASGFLAKGPSGLAYNPGTGLAEKWDNHFFICDFTGANSAVIAFRMEPDGAGFKIERSENFVSGFLNTDIEFGYDGKVYVSDYVGSWPTHGFGNIFTFENPVELAKPETRSVRGIFASGFDTLEPEKLAELLRHPDMRVRLRAQFALAKNITNRDLFLSATNASEPLVTRLHGVWGLGNLARQKKDSEAAQALAELSGDSEPKVRGQAVKALGDSGQSSGLKAALSLLTDPDPRTRMLAAISTGKLGEKDQVPPLMRVIAQNNDGDEFLRHGAIEGLVQIGDADAVFAFARNEFPAIRRAVVLALRRFEDPRVAHFLKDPDLSIAIDAAQAINDAYIEGARNDLAAATRLLGKVSWMTDLRVLHSMLRAGGKENVQHLLAVAANPNLSEKIRVEALFLLRRWEEPPPIDLTTGMHRPISGDRRIGDAQREEIRGVLLPLLIHTNGDLLVEVLGCAGQFGVKVPVDSLLSQVAEAKNPIDVRLAALKELEAKNLGGFIEILEDLLGDQEGPMRVAALKALGRIAPEKAFAAVEKILESGKIPDQQAAIGLLGTLNHPESSPRLLQLLNDLPNQALPLRLDILEAAPHRKDPALASAITAYEASLPKDDPLAAFEITLEGGDAGNGRRIFFNNGIANCAQCHKVGQRGGDAGPNLEKIASSQDNLYLLESIIVPNAQLAPGYSMIALTMKDGSVVAGFLIKKTDTEVVIRDVATKKETSYPTQDIAIIPPGVSTMPPMGHILSKSEIRDLLAFLASLK